MANKVRKGKGDFGFNARTGEYKPLIAAGVLDPAKVAITAFLNAASIAALLLTTDCLVAEKKAETPGSARSSAPEKMDETF